MLLALLPGAWCHVVSCRTGWSSVSILWLSKIVRLICNFHLSVAHILINKQIHPWDKLRMLVDIKKSRNRSFALFVGCLTSQQHASASLERICSDNFMCCHTEIEVADKNFHLTQSQYTDTRPTSPSTEPITPGAWQGSHWSANFYVTGMTRPQKNPSGIQTWDLPLSRQTP